jgi:hypothetical protein
MAAELVTIEFGELILLGTNIVTPESVGSGTTSNTYLAGDSTFKDIGGVGSSVGTILNKYNFGGF